MKKALIVLVILAALAGGAFLYITRPLPAPSVPTDTMTTDTPSDTTDTDVAGETPAPAGSTAYVITSSKSEAKFEIDEVLNNEPFHVVGTTADVSGQINIDSANPSNSTVGTIKINARTLKTDSTRRDGMIGRMILKSETNEFITFAPKSFSGLPETVEIGKDYTFKTTGTLTIAGTAKEVTFDIIAKAASASEISGVATTTIKYADYSVSIPPVPLVASVEDDVALTFSFVAEKK